VADDRDDPVPDRVVFIAVVFAAVGVSWFFSNLFATRKTAAANNQPIPAAISKGNSKVTINNSYLAAHPLVSQDDSRITANNVAWGDDDTAAAALWVRTVQQAKGDNHKLEALIKVRHDQCVKAWQGLSEEQRRRKMESLESDENLIRTELESR
jgi:hypothetical protein